MKKQYTEVREVLRRLVQRGYTIVSVEVSDDGDDDLHMDNGVITPQMAYDKINEYDDGFVYVNDGTTTRFLQFVLGNEPGVALSNYSANDEVIDQIGTEVYDLYNSENAYNDLVDLQDEVEKCKAKILSETDCFTPETGLFQMVCILISQRDNAYNEADVYKKQVQKYKNIV